MGILLAHAGTIGCIVLTEFLGREEPSAIVHQVISQCLVELGSTSESSHSSLPKCRIISFLWSGALMFKSWSQLSAID